VLGLLNLNSVDLTDIAEFSRLCAAVGGTFSAESTQPVTENGARVSTGSAQGVAEVTERGKDPTSTVAERRRQAVDELGVTTT